MCPPAQCCCSLIYCNGYYCFVYIGDPKRLQDHDGLGQGHLQECAVCSPGRQWEKVQNVCDPTDFFNRFAQHPVWCQQSKCVRGLWVHVCKLIKSWTGHCSSWVYCPCGHCVPVLPALGTSQVCGETDGARRGWGWGGHGQMWQKRRGMKRRVGKGQLDVSVCCIVLIYWLLWQLVCMSVSCCVFRYGRWCSDTLLRNQRFSIVVLEREGCQLPSIPHFFLPSAPIHCSFTFLLS